jgi:hypothetical protein
MTQWFIYLTLFDGLFEMEICKKSGTCGTRTALAMLFWSAGVFQALRCQARV